MIDEDGANCVFEVSCGVFVGIRVRIRRGRGLSQDQIGDQDQTDDQDQIDEEFGASEGTRCEGGASERGLEAVHGQSAGRFWWWTDGSILSRVFHVECLGDRVGFSILDLGGEIEFFGFVFSIKLAWSYS